jgi:hypothetical protein
VWLDSALYNIGGPVSFCLPTASTTLSLLPVALPLAAFVPPPPPPPQTEADFAALVAASDAVIEKERRKRKERKGKEGQGR